MGGGLSGTSPALHTTIGYFANSTRGGLGRGASGSGLAGSAGGGGDEAPGVRVTWGGSLGHSSRGPVCEGLPEVYAERCSATTVRIFRRTTSMLMSSGEGTGAAWAGCGSCPLAANTAAVS